MLRCLVTEIKRLNRFYFSEDWGVSKITHIFAEW